MSSTWATNQREQIAEINLNNTGKATPPSPVQEFAITTISSILTGDSTSEAAADSVHQWLTSLPASDDLENAWYQFHSLIYSAAMSTSSDKSHQGLVDLLFALAHRGGGDDNSSPSAQILAELKEFSWTARDLWNGPETFSSYKTNPAQAHREWVNLNRFLAHLSVQQRNTPVAPLKNWVEDMGMWTITDGLETASGENDENLITEHAEAAAAWLVIAGGDIYADEKWGGRDGNSVNGGPQRAGELWGEMLARGAAEQAGRWDFWKQRLGQIAGDKKNSQAIRNAARGAEGAMTKVES
ncbi:hypothetical protein QBC35DRAFT_467294 [Podospora australis]|uniref:Uncharacterized protein n=1 Tax=Podospora australis TaxID=1536484 RepID=A0AAN7ADR6_9PEZI|nr:hypothetical protein QBC35DRAFT_467294 [Podospora australis]